MPDSVRSPAPPGDTSRPLARPPIVYLVSILLGLALHRIAPLEVFPHRLESAAGPLLVALAVVLFALSVREFRRAATPIPSTRPVTAVVGTGPYRYSRNPIYVSFTLLQVGIAIWVNEAWLLATLVPTLVLIEYGVIRREERYLTRKFGDEYLRYKATVRRWL